MKKSSPVQTDKQFTSQKLHCETFSAGALVKITLANSGLRELILSHLFHFHLVRFVFEANSNSSNPSLCFYTSCTWLAAAGGFVMHHSKPSSRASAAAAASPRPLGSSPALCSRVSERGEGKWCLFRHSRGLQGSKHKSFAHFHGFHSMPPS